MKVSLEKQTERKNENDRAMKAKFEERVNDDSPLSFLRLSFQSFKAG